MSMVMDVVKLHKTRFMVKTRFHSVVIKFSIVAFRLTSNNSSTPSVILDDFSSSKSRIKQQSKTENDSRKREK